MRLLFQLLAVILSYLCWLKFSLSFLMWICCYDIYTKRLVCARLASDILSTLWIISFYYWPPTEFGSLTKTKLVLELFRHGERFYSGFSLHQHEVRLKFKKINHQPWLQIYFMKFSIVNRQFVFTTSLLEFSKYFLPNRFVHLFDEMNWSPKSYENAFVINYVENIVGIAID